MRLNLQPGACCGLAAGRGSRRVLGSRLSAYPPWLHARFTARNRHWQWKNGVTFLSHPTSLSRLFDGDRTQSYSHAHSDAGISCLALYDLQPVTDHAKPNNPPEFTALIGLD